jgi:hypothetical protein
MAKFIFVENFQQKLALRLPPDIKKSILCQEYIKITEEDNT